MNDTVLASLLAALVAALGGLLVPFVLAQLPEPEPPSTPLPEGETPPPPYAELAARPGLGWRCAVVAGVLGGVVGATQGLVWSLVWLAPLVPVAVALAFVDWHTRLLPRRIVVPATLAALAAVLVVGLATDQRDALVRAVVAMVVARSFFWVLWFVHATGLGFGDVRLAALVGLVLGWEGWGAVALGLWSGFVALGVPGVLLALVRRDLTLVRKAYPFGPAMLAGALVGLVWGTALGARVWG
ncbi:A24 family peptidase [Nocardioides palaemonis]|uniref:A24 family peptidase n=1 Tax=Nocardioides palaemonis TaxID=2829810 RepID=UPI0027DE9827|nr:A24 family peptidase [Nocardioides palaemonis]